MDVYQAETSFIRQCIDHIEDRLEALDLKVCPKPSLDEIKSTPVRAIQIYLKATLRTLEDAGWPQPRVVLLIDEFTYLFEYIKESIIESSFMRQWKALLELGLFSAVVIGQDSMPKFKQAFPNEFGVTHDERISYLSNEAATDLAQNPIQIGEQVSWPRHRSTRGIHCREPILSPNHVRSPRKAPQSAQARIRDRG
jgi:hypothetical protein